MGRYRNSGLFNGTKGNRQTSIEQNDYNKIMHLLNKEETISTTYKINLNKQNKHIKTSGEYVEGRSEITISASKCQQLIDEFAGKGQKITENKERVDFNEIIGNYISINGEKQPTTIGIIHKSKTGFHIVPAAPKGEKK